MKIGIIGNGFVGRATQIFAKNYYSGNDNEERFEILPDTASTPAKPNSIRTYRADGVPYDPSDDLLEIIWNTSAIFQTNNIQTIRSPYL